MNKFSRVRTITLIQALWNIVSSPIFYYIFTYMQHFYLKGKFWWKMRKTHLATKLIPKHMYVLYCLILISQWIVYNHINPFDDVLNCSMIINKIYSKFTFTRTSKHYISFYIMEILIIMWAMTINELAKLNNTAI